MEAPWIPPLAYHGLSWHALSGYRDEDEDEEAGSEQEEHQPNLPREIYPVEGNESDKKNQRTYEIQPEGAEKYLLLSADLHPGSPEGIAIVTRRISSPKRPTDSPLVSR
jgi:hypothetical protein